MSAQNVLFTIKQNALLPVITLTLTPKNFSYDLSAASAIEFRYRKKADATVETVALDHLDDPTYQVTLTPTAGMVDTKGKFDCHVKVTIGGKDLFFPQKGFDLFEVTDTF